MGPRANGCPWDEGTCILASEQGRLEVLQWARANGCPWNERICSIAAEGGHLEVLQWAEQMGVHGMKTRAQELRLVVIWKYYNGREPTDVRGMKRRGRRLEVLQWARENGCPSLEKYKEE